MDFSGQEDGLDGGEVRMEWVLMFSDNRPWSEVLMDKSIRRRCSISRFQVPRSKQRRSYHHLYGGLFSFTGASSGQARSLVVHADLFGS